jgi:hypothetical protein
MVVPRSKHAATVEHLVQKAHLDPDTALAIATAIDMALQNAQLVTVPILDARLAASNAEMKAGFASSEANCSVALEKTKTEVVRWVFLVLLGNVALSLAANALLNALQHRG